VLADERMATSVDGLYFCVILCLFYSSVCNGQATLLSADGKTDTYSLLAKVLGSSPIDGCDCSHPSFGPHITQVLDSTLNKYVFAFYIHVTPDNDRCINFDRQRNEIKVYGGSVNALKGHMNDTVTYQWKFKLPAGFKPSPNFCHIHQIKSGDGSSADGAPLLTLTPRLGTPNLVQLIHMNSAVVKTANLSDFEGTWVQATEKIRYGRAGTYDMRITRVSDHSTVLSYSSSNFDIWAPDTETTFCRPKWGIYRSLLSQADLRDEEVLFADFCMAKGTESCP